MTVVVVLLFAVSAPIAGVRWLRVAQREHYLAGETTRFAIRWWKTGPGNVALITIAVAAAVAALFIPWVAVVTIQVVAIGPLGLSMRGRTSPLAWTRRLKTVATTSAALTAGVIVAGILAGIPAFVAALSAVVMPLVIDLALLGLTPLERRAAQRYVTSARDRLDKVAPTRVAITGSFGKTTTKGYIRHLLESTRSVVASPASFNNTGGLSRTVNELLGQDTEIFVAEMGTYGPGEIRDLCSWVKPDIAVLCNIGPVHLQRFKSLDNVVAAKAEIFEHAPIAVINIDAHGLMATADTQRKAGKKVVTCSAQFDSEADVIVAITPDRTTLVLGDGKSREVVVPQETAPINVACAVAVAIELDVPVEAIISLLATLPRAEHRCHLSISPMGVTVIDDTYNSNPAGATAALSALGKVDAARRVVVTPGMVELGSQQDDANRKFAADAAALADDIIIVGFTNQRPLREGASQGAAKVHHVRFHTQAVEWVRANLGAGDAVLYENDLPDHYA